MTELFHENRLQFFRPLNGKYRAQVVDCLAAFYQRLYGSLEERRLHYSRDKLIELCEEAIARSPVFDDDDEYVVSRRTPREQANWILNLLLEHGWIERHIDDATLQATYAFSRFGRLFTQPMVESLGGRFRTRHRNTRNTRNALQSFLDKGEVYDLLDAFEYSERIVADFSDVIAELDERRRQLVKEVEAQQVVQRASDEFFDFMEKRFMPDLAIRMSADSVEKYRSDIADLISRIKRKRKEFKASAERELRRTAPELIREASQSVLMFILDGIESRLHDAATVMLPALRHALHSFTRRADIIIRQLSYSGAGGRNPVQQFVDQYRNADTSQQNNVLEQLGNDLAALSVELPDPDSLRLNEKRALRVVNSTVDDNQNTDIEARKHLFVQTAVDLAFTFTSQAQRDYLITALGEGHRIHSHNLPVRDARELLMCSHIIETAAMSSSEFRLKITPTGERIQTEYFEACDEFTIELIESPHAK